MTTKTTAFTDALAGYADALRNAYRNLPPGSQEEAQLATPLSNFLTAAAVALNFDLYAYGEVTTDQGRPDLGITVKKVLTGYVELKAPGKGADPRHFRNAHDRAQWRQFQLLPNLIYTDGIQWTLYRSGERSGPLIDLGEMLEHGRRALEEQATIDLANLLRDFLLWEPIVPADPKQLAKLLAPLTHFLREQVLAAAGRDGSTLSELAREWRAVLFSDADDTQFADGYAQTITYSLLLARLESTGGLDLSSAVQILSRRHALLGKALQLLSVPDARDEIGVGLNLLERVIASVDPRALTKGERDPWLYFYEDFLAAYDRKLRNDRGVYYTPVEVIQAQCRLVEDLLKRRLSKPQGLANPQVTLLDPACGTGAYLVTALEHALDRITLEEGPGALPARATQFGAQMHGFELLVGPYTVAHLRLTQKLLDAGATLPDDGAHIYLTDTLESPHAQPLQSSILTRELTDEHRRAQRVKAEVPILVCIGNPPYDRQQIDPDDQATERKGGWIRFGEQITAGEGKGTRERPLLEDFLEPARKSGGGGHLKNLYNDYVYFWRWALWKVFEQQDAPGIVTFISASSYLRGPGFVGMREWMRRLADRIWILDLEGDNLGARKTENVFAIRTPVAIAVVARFGEPNQDTPADVRYARLAGTRTEKLGTLTAIERFADLDWHEAYTDWQAPFLPRGRGDYFAWPRLTDIFPWQHTGAEVKRTWPIGETRELLVARWKSLLERNDKARTRAFKETRDRKTSRSYRDLRSDERLPPIDHLAANIPPLRIDRYSYRSWDRQWILSDNRLGDFLRPVLWVTYSAEQVYITSMLTKVLGAGPAAVVTDCVPDRDYFCGRGGKDVAPLWRDSKATEPNITKGLLDLLAATFGLEVKPEDLLAYVYALLATPAYVERFSEELTEPGPRLPLTRDAERFRASVMLGRKLVALHTYGARWPPPEWNGRVPKGTARVERPIPHTEEAYPEDFRYDESANTLHVGDGAIGPVSPEVWTFSVSGLEVVKSWLAYRMKQGAGRTSSDLDKIRPTSWTAEMTRELLELHWVIEATVALFPDLEANLDAVLNGPIFRAEELPVPTAQERAAPRSPARATASQTTRELFDEQDRAQ